MGKEIMTSIVRFIPWELLFHTIRIIDRPVELGEGADGFRMARLPTDALTAAIALEFATKYYRPPETFNAIVAVFGNPWEFIQWLLNHVQNMSFQHKFKVGKLICMTVDDVSQLKEYPILCHALRTCKLFIEWVGELFGTAVAELKENDYALVRLLWQLYGDRSTFGEDDLYSLNHLTIEDEGPMLVDTLSALYEGEAFGEGRSAAGTNANMLKLVYETFLDYSLSASASS
jgi:hypothetical protein